MRVVLFILLLFICGTSMAQVDSLRLKSTLLQLDKALVEKDSLVLSRLLNKKLSFGHSNGWVQTKPEVWPDFASGKLEYKKINTTSIEIVSIDRKKAVLRTNAEVAGKAGENEFAINLHILQVWVKEKKGWQLLARQSTKLN